MHCAHRWPEQTMSPARELHRFRPAAPSIGETIAELEADLRRRPSDFDLHCALGTLYLQLTADVRAGALFERALAIAASPSQRVRARRLLGEVHRRRARLLVSPARA
jgi:cytochrome c-type biogenesis protein CcmH/NrfG